MTSAHDRIAGDLNRAFSRLSVHADIVATEDGVVVPQETARRLIARLSFLEGGSRAPFVWRLMQRPPAGGVVLRGDEGMHLHRALVDIERATSRAERIDRGQIPGALSGAEVSRLARRHPQMFLGRH